MPGRQEEKAISGRENITYKGENKRKVLVSSKNGNQFESGGKGGRQTWRVKQEQMCPVGSVKLLKALSRGETHSVLSFGKSTQASEQSSYWRERAKESKETSKRVQVRINEILT